jgi:23S rRNA (guanosine2251-2'-O)-methyltransferase
MPKQDRFRKGPGRGGPPRREGNPSRGPEDSRADRPRPGKGRPDQSRNERSDRSPHAGEGRHSRDGAPSRAGGEGRYSKDGAPRGGESRHSKGGAPSRAAGEGRHSKDGAPRHGDGRPHKEGGPRHGEGRFSKERSPSRGEGRHFKEGGAPRHGENRHFKDRPPSRGGESRPFKDRAPSRADNDRHTKERAPTPPGAPPRPIERPPVVKEPVQVRAQTEAPAPKDRGEGRHAKESRAGEVWIYGHHAVVAALANPARKTLRLMGTTEALAKLTEEVGSLGQARPASRREIDNVVGEDAVHQGIAMLTRALDHNLTDILEMTSNKPNACLVVLDQVTDPHNVGAILRSAAAFGASAVIAPDRHAADESGAMAKSASGALDKIAYVKSTNLVRALEEIKEHQFWLVGLDADAPQALGQLKLGGRIALVVGAEGEGLRRLVRETCDHVARLPMAGDMESLNVSNAAAVALYEKVRQDAKG